MVPSEHPGSDRGPLAGIRVLDLTGNVAGPFGTLVLADLGADVVKLERPGRGEDSRHLAPLVEGRSATFEALNRGKRSIALDLRSTQGKAVGRRLVAESDVLVESMRPGKLNALGFGEEALRELQPELIYASLSGFGQTGPLRERPGYDMLVQARTGIMHITGESGGPPVRVGPSIVDIGTGMWLAMAVLAARLRQCADAEAGFQRLDVSLFDAGVAWMILPLLQYSMTGVEPARMGGQTPIASPADIYETSDGFVTVSILNDKIWETFAEELALDAERVRTAYATNSDRVANRDALTAEISECLRKETTQHWVEVLRPRGVTIEAVNPTSALLTDPQALARDLLALVPDQIPGAGLQVRLPIHNSGFGPRAAVAAAPVLGGHTDEVLEGIGLTAAERDLLRADGVIA